MPNVISATIEPSLTLSGIGKCYRVPDPQHSPQGWLGRLSPRPFREFWAVRDISFSLNPGEALGIVGHNGAGKSTLLKLLSCITSPTEGEISVRGRLAGLLEVGSGFHPELTGRENIFLSGTILGMRRAEIHRKLDSIIEFAEVRPFIDLPVKRYSSGMYVRLGFSIAAHLEPEILLLDEVLAVGDAAFQRKCLDHVKSLRDSGVSVIFISHDLKAVEQLCPRSLLLRHGQIVYDGDTAGAISAYQSVAAGGSGVRRVDHQVFRAEVRGLRFLDASGQDTGHGTCGEPLRVQLDYVAHEPLNDAFFEIQFNNSANQTAASLSTIRRRVTLPAGEGTIEFRCEPFCLGPDVYTLDALIEVYGVAEPLDWRQACRSLLVQSETPVKGSFSQPFDWKLLL